MTFSTDSLCLHSYLIVEDWTNWHNTERQKQQGIPALVLEDTNGGCDRALSLTTEARNLLGSRHPLCFLLDTSEQLSLREQEGDWQEEPDIFFQVLGSRVCFLFPPRFLILIFFLQRGQKRREEEGQRGGQGRIRPSISFTSPFWVPFTSLCGLHDPTTLTWGLFGRVARAGRYFSRSSAPLETA